MNLPFGVGEEGAILASSIANLGVVEEWPYGHVALNDT